MRVLGEVEQGQGQSGAAVVGLGNSGPHRRLRAPPFVWLGQCTLPRLAPPQQHSSSLRRRSQAATQRRFDIDLSPAVPITPSLSQPPSLLQSAHGHCPLPTSLRFRSQSPRIVMSSSAQLEMIAVAKMREIAKLPENCRCADCDSKGHTTRAKHTAAQRDGKRPNRRRCTNLRLLNKREGVASIALRLLNNKWR